MNSFDVLAARLDELRLLVDPESANAVSGCWERDMMSRPSWRLSDAGQAIKDLLDVVEAQQARIRVLEGLDVGRGASVDAAEAFRMIDEAVGDAGVGFDVLGAVGAAATGGDESAHASPWSFCSFGECSSCGSGVLAHVHRDRDPATDDGDNDGRDEDGETQQEIDVVYDDSPLVCESPECRLTGRWSCDEGIAVARWGRDHEEFMSPDEHALALNQAYAEAERARGGSVTVPMAPLCERGPTDV